MKGILESRRRASYTDVILSIKPKYCDEIVRGTKKYEFRRVSFNRHTHLVYMYSTAPVGKIVGTFEVKRIIEDIPKILWTRFKDGAGIDEKEFFSYFEGVKTGFAIEIKNVRELEPYDPKLLISDFEPPQSYIYVPKKKEECTKLLDFIGSSMQKE
jgi:type I restriction enzyme S subunit